MRLTILGGGGFRVPLVHRALLGDERPGRVDELVLHDTDADRLAVIEAVLAQQTDAAGGAPVRVWSTTDPDRALEGTDMVFSAIRVGGLRGRTCDERVALDLGLLGQETVGPGGIAYGLRTVPVALDLADRVRRLAPDAWFINFTNPAGLITQALQGVLGERAIGICDSPVGLWRRALHAVGADPAKAEIGYSGLNHLGWLTHLRVDGEDLLPALLADDDALLGTEEGRLFGPARLRELGGIPNEYLWYYEHTAEAIAGLGGAQTRGEFLLDQQGAFYRAALADRAAAFALWEATRREREETYLAEARRDDEARDDDDLSGGGYEGVALALMRAIARDEPARLILNVRNGTTLPGLAPDTVVEVPCRVDAAGPRPLPGTPTLTADRLALAQRVKTVDGLVLDAVRTGSPELAAEAFARHPLVADDALGRALVQGYRRRLPEVDAVFTPAAPRPGP